MMKEAVVFLLCVLGTVCIVDACNDAVCASIVSRCQLIQSCRCDMSNKTNCPCCVDCQHCLARLYTDCCSCVGLCPMPDLEDSIFKTSSIEILTDPIPELFNALTQEEDELQRWTTHAYPVFYDILKNSKHDYVREQLMGGTKSQFGAAGPYNCTVAFMSECTSLGKCKQACKSMGSAKMRWFHDGCCQCIADTCIDYGLNDSHCLRCREEDDDDEEYRGEITKDEGDIEPKHKRKHEHDVQN